MAHPLVLAGQTGRADDLAVCLGKVPHIIYRSGLTAQLILLCGEIQRDALRAIAEVFRFAADDLQESQQRCGVLRLRTFDHERCLLRIHVFFLYFGKQWFSPPKII